MTTRRERLLRVAALEDEAISKIIAMRRRPWRLVRNARLRTEVRRLFAECDAEFAAIAEAKARYGKPGMTKADEHLLLGGFVSR